ncbi:MAG: hypothetical protein Q4C47_03720, partial [Planctomycetia bacterium]|nr:hypothetical protein [Planctomycetia bacterium]
MNWKSGGPSLSAILTMTTVVILVTVLTLTNAGTSQEVIPATGRPEVVVERGRRIPVAKPGQPTTPEEISVKKPRTFDDCAKLMAQGFWKETYEGVVSLIFDGERPTLKDAAPLSMAAISLANLNRADETDALLDRVLERYRDDWRGRVAVVTQRLRLGTRVCRVGETVCRGKWVDGGEWLSSVRRDRVASLKILRDTIPLAEKDPSPERAAIYQTLAATLRWNTPDWKLQLRTDLDGDLPDYDESEFFGDGDHRGTPVEENGEPVYYAVPRRFEDAVNDGERWRWCLEQTAEADASRLGEIRIEWASFLASQFGVQTLGEGFYGRNSDTELPQSLRSARFQLESLDDTETIARLADGVRRFELPPEFNYIRVLRDVTEMERRTVGISWAQAMTLLGREYENRRQYSRAVEWYDRILEAEEELRTRHGKEGEQLVGQITEARQSIVGERAMIEILSPGKRTLYVGTGPDGNPNPVQFALNYRNATLVTFTAMKLDLTGAIRDMRKETEELAAASRLPENVSRPLSDTLFFGLLREPRMGIRTELAPYLPKEPTVTWKESLVPADDHHDRRIVLNAPLQDPGLYYIMCQPDSHLRSGSRQPVQYSLLWVDEAILTRRLSENSLVYHVNRADDGTPISGAEALCYGVARLPE